MIERTLDNGIKLVGQHLPNMRSATIGIWTAAGSGTELPEENGISHFIEHMLFKGTGRRSAKQISVDVDRIGGQMNAFTSKEMTCYYIRVMDEKLDDGVDILTDLFTGSTFPKDEVERERGVVLEEIAMSRDTLDDVALDLLAGVFFDGTPLGRTILGPEENIKRFTRDDMLSYMSRLYTGQNMAVAIAGSFDEDHVVDLLNRKLQGTRTEPAVVPESANMSGFVTKPGVVYTEKEAEQMHMCFGFPTASKMDDRSRRALDVLNNVIGGSMSSRLFQKIREQMGMAYAVYSHPSLYRDTGVFEIYAGTSPRNIEDVPRLILEEMAAVRESGITREEFEQSKQMLKGLTVLQMESTGSRMSSLGKSWIQRGEIHSEEEILQSIEDVTMDDVAEQIAIVTDPAKMSAACIGPGGDGEGFTSVVKSAQAGEQV